MSFNQCFGVKPKLTHVYFTVTKDRRKAKKQKLVKLRFAHHTYTFLSQQASNFLLEHIQDGDVRQKASGLSSDSRESRSRNPLWGFFLDNPSVVLGCSIIFGITHYCTIAQRSSVTLKTHTGFLVMHTLHGSVKRSAFKWFLLPLDVSFSYQETKVTVARSGLWVMFALWIEKGNEIWRECFFFFFCCNAPCFIL